MIDSLVTGIVHLLSGMFIIGVAGCVIAIPLIAYKMFRVLFEPDAADE